MPQIESSNYYFTISNQPYPTGYINQTTNLNTFGVPAINLPQTVSSQYVPMQTSGASILASNSFVPTSSAVLRDSTDTSSMPRNPITSQNRPFTTSAQNTSIRRTKSGYISKASRVAKRSNVEINLHKSCPGCLKLWRKCQCSNIKNRPDPKPYCKFIPPRMLRKLNAQN